MSEIKFDWRNYLNKNKDLQNKKGTTSKDALNHYLTTGRHQKNILEISR